MVIGQVAVRPWGNSQGIRIPKAILEQLGSNVSNVLQDGQKIEIDQIYDISSDVLEKLDFNF